MVYGPFDRRNTLDLFFEFLLNAASLPGMPRWIRVLVGVLLTLVFLVAVGALALYALAIPGPWPLRLVAGLFAVALVLGYGGMLRSLKR